MKRYLQFPLMDEEGGDGSNAGGADGGDGGAGGGNSGDASRPDYLPEKFWNAETGEANMESLATSYTHLEKKINTSREDMFKEFEQGRLANRPESAEHYELKVDREELGLPDGVDVTLNPDDPMLVWWRDVAFENGYTQDQFNAGIQQYLKKEFGDLPDMEAQKAELGENAQARINRVELWARKVAGDESFEEVQFALGNASSVKFLEKLMKASGGIDMSDVGDGSMNTGLTKNEVKAMMDDPRYWRDGDQAYIDKVNKAWNSLGG